MPRAASICYIQGCTRKTVRSGRCEEHAPAIERPWSRQSVRNRARDRVWERRVRPQSLARDGFACVVCGARQQLQVDHIVPISRGGTWDLENAQTLCRTCHLEKTVRDRKS
ncbi:HNH endonuclease [Streptomyces sp. NPDC053048]|uniref:HNH endonuclease n=1 Tax=Streptomyces sp. NPDC053048 TaxID=3365694 RepID=UPI0037D1704A